MWTPSRLAFRFRGGEPVNAHQMCTGCITLAVLGVALGCGRQAEGREPKEHAPWLTLYTEGQQIATRR